MMFDIHKLTGFVSVWPVDKASPSFMLLDSSSLHVLGVAHCH